MSKPIILTDNNFYKEINGSKPILIHCYAPWVGPSHMIEPILSELAVEYANQLKVGILNTEENDGATIKYGVVALPTLLLFKHGELVARIQGALPKKELLSKLLPILNANDEEESAVKLSKDTKEVDEKKFATLQRLAELRMQDLKASRNKLISEAKTFQKRASFFRVLVIVLGALVAAKAVIDQFMVDYQMNPVVRMSVDLTFMIIGLAISIAAGLQEAFKYERRAATLLELSQRTTSLTREFMSSIDYPNISFKSLWSVIQKQNAELESLYKDAAQSGLNLASDNEVEYANLLSTLKREESN